MNQKYKINIFDTLLVIIVILFAVSFIIALKDPVKIPGKESRLTIQITGNDEIITNEAQKKGNVYFNGTKNPVEISEVKKGNGYSNVVLKGLGEKKGEIYIFNGQRILIGQKAEVHGTFFAQGLITEFKVVE